MLNSNTELVSLIIPVYNEAAHLESFLTQVDALELECEKELVFVDDASKDSSQKILREFSFKSRHKIILGEVNEGKGAALRKGFAAATGTIIGVQDADFEYDMTEITTLLRPLLNRKADVIYGSRFLRGHAQVHRTYHYLVNRILTVFSNLSSGLYLSDMETCYKFFRTEIIQNVHLQSNRFGFEPEITAKIACLRVRVHEYPISYFPRNYMEGKKISWKDGIAALWHIFYFNFVLSQRSFFKESMPKEFFPQSRQWL